MLKRSIDIIAAGTGLLMLSPILGLIALWIKIDSPGPVFYRGKRAGQGGKEFEMLKFRSMSIDADRIGGPSTSGDDSRITRSGRFIRRWKLDELSQLINVLRGSMSLVGPRPEVLDKVARYTAAERQVLRIRPGITDWASLWNCDEGSALSGVSDADAVYERVIRPHKMRLQQYYVANHSLWSDVRILVYTLLRIGRPSIIPRELEGFPTQPQLRAEVLAFDRQLGLLHLTSA